MCDLGSGRNSTETPGTKYLRESLIWGRSVQDWPNGRNSAALASRIALLNVVSTHVGADRLNDDQEALVKLVILLTRLPENTESDFDQAFVTARDAVVDRLSGLSLDPSFIVLLDSIAAAEANDLVTNLFSALQSAVELAYGRTFNASLRLILGKVSDRHFAIRGAVTPRDKSSVELTLYRNIGLETLPLIPYILAHEFICHVAAGHSSGWVETPDPDIRDFFGEGFMSQIAWTLIADWIEGGDVPGVAPMAFLRRSQTPYMQSRPHAFAAGEVAWNNCRQLVGQSPGGRRDGWKMTVAGGLSLNTCPLAMPPKDIFVDRARSLAAPELQTFVALTQETISAEELLGSVSR